MPTSYPAQNTPPSSSLALLLRASVPLCPLSCLLPPLATPTTPTDDVRRTFSLHTRRWLVITDDMHTSPSPLADDLARLRVSAQTESVRRGPRDVLAALLMACLARLFARLEDMLRLWQSGQLPPPPPPRAQAEAPLTHPASVPPEPRANPWSLSAWLSGLWPFAATPDFRAPAPSRAPSPCPSARATFSPRASRPAPSGPARPTTQAPDRAPVPAIHSHFPGRPRPIPTSMARQPALPHPARAPPPASRAKFAPMPSRRRMSILLRNRIEIPQENGPCRNRARPDD